MAERLSPYYDILFREKGGFNAHEFIIDIRPIKKDMVLARKILQKD